MLAGAAKVAAVKGEVMLTVGAALLVTVIFTGAEVVTNTGAVGGFGS